MSKSTIRSRPEPLEALLVDRWRGALDDERAARLDALLADDPAARREAAELERLWQRLGELEAPAPRPELARRFDAVLDAYRHGLRDGLESSRARPAANDDAHTAGARRWPPAHVALALAALLIGLIGGRLLAPGAGDLARLDRQVDTLARTVSLELLRDPAANQRLAGARYARELDPAAESGGDRELLAALLDAAREDPSANVRLAALDALGRYLDQPPVTEGLRRALARERTPLVQVALVDLLLARGGPDERAAVRRLRREPLLDDAVRAHIDSHFES